METKICKRCESVCPLSEFKYGKNYCYSCQKLYANEWKAKNRERVAEYNKKYKAEHRDEISIYNTAYSLNNRDTIQQRSSANYLRLYHEDPNFKVAHLLRARVRKTLNGNIRADSALEFLGCTLDFFKAWLTYCFAEDMNFDNHGNIWHIDHTIPCSKFNFTNDSEQKICFHWSNMKPMYAVDNISKNNRATLDEIKEHEKKMALFLENETQKYIGQYSIIEVDRAKYIN
jgi:hypothetical protein